MQKDEGGHPGEVTRTRKLGKAAKKKPQKNMDFKPNLAVNLNEAKTIIK